MNQGAQPFAELARLHFLIGKWKTRGVVVPEGGSPEVRFHGTDAYEWVSGGFFLLHTVDVMMSDEHVKSIEVIGFEPESKNYTLRSFDNTGHFLMMYGSFNDAGAFVVVGENMRSTLAVTQPGKMMNAVWEQSKDGKAWVPWMSLTLTK
jgi:hypothetical protein